MEHLTINNSVKSALDLTMKSAEAVSQINQMIVDQNQDLSKKMINFNVEMKLQDLRAEGIANGINVLA